MLPTEPSRLASLRALNLLDTPPEERFDRITRLAQRTFGVPIALISLIDEKRVWYKSRLGIEQAEMPRDGSFCEGALSGDGLMIVPDAPLDQRFAAHPMVAGGPKIRFYAGHPLEGPDGSVIGTLSILDRMPRDLDLEQRRALRDLAGMVQEQLAAPRTQDPPDDEHSRLLARLRLTPENAVARRRSRAAFLVLAAALILGTAFSMRLARTLAADADRIEAVVKPEALEAERAPLARLRSTARFFSVAVGARAILATALLMVILLAFERHLDARLAILAAVELDRARLQAVIDAIGDGVVVADARGRFTLFNPAAERILGLGMVDDPDHSSRFYLSFFEEDGVPREPEKHPLVRAIAGESARGERLVVRNERRPGGVSVTVTATPVLAFDGSPAGGVIIFRDAA